MTDVGNISNEEFAEIWDQMKSAEQQAGHMEQRLDAIHERLDELLETLESYNDVSEEQVPHQKSTDSTPKLQK